MLNKPSRRGERGGNENAKETAESTARGIDRLQMRGAGEEDNEQGRADLSREARDNEKRVSAFFRGNLN